MGVDPGATFSLISEVTFKRLWGKRPVPLKPSTLQLSTYTGESLKAWKEVMVVVRHHGQEKTLPLLIVPGDGASLLGRNWMGQFPLAWREVHKLHSVKPADRPFCLVPRTVWR